MFIWSVALFPLLFVTCLLVFQSEEDLPPIEMLDNPPELLASVIYADDGETELGRYWKINRSSVEYKDISPFVIDALVSTEDERFYEHSGVDARALGRALVNAGGAGGASTISQQLAKLLFTLQEREREELARAQGESVARSSGKIGRMFSRLNEKARENIIATRLEERYTKEEIVTMYLNQFDFLYNAVGIANASKVYFNKLPKDLSKDEAAMLVGMCKNPDLYNPYTFSKRNYRTRLAKKQNITTEQVTKQQVAEARANDSLRAVSRRNQVLYQWLKNSKRGNEDLRTKITQEEYDQLKNKPLTTDYQKVDHKRGAAPYFRESVRAEVTNILAEKNDDGSYKYQRADGTPWNIYSDGLKIYTTLNADLQKYAESAVERHLKENLQPAFDRNNKNVKNFPFSNDLNKETIDNLMKTAMKRSDRYISLKASGVSEGEIFKTFYEPTQMTVFSWKGEIDTTMTPYDSIRYYKSFLHAGLLSVEPETGFVKAWVGGANIDHFAFDHVRLGKRQVGSTIKPFIYAAGIAMNVVTPCTKFANIPYCVELYGPNGNPNGQWCPKNAGGKMDGRMITVKTGLKNSMNNITVAIMSKMGAKAGPQTAAKMMEALGIELNPADIVPAMCLGTMDLSLYELVGAQAAFANQGIFNKPTTILRIEDRNGNIIYNAKPLMREAINDNVAYSVLKMMEGVVNGGTAGSLRGGLSWGGIRYPTAGKTGTTQNNSDGWFVGLTPDLATGIWVGAEDRGVRFRTMEWGQGGRMALPVYGYYMQQVYKDPKLGISTTAFAKPKNFSDDQFNCIDDPEIEDGAETVEVPIL